MNFLARKFASVAIRPYGMPPVGNFAPNSMRLFSTSMPNEFDSEEVWYFFILLFLIAFHSILWLYAG